MENEKLSEHLIHDIVNLLIERIGEVKKHVDAYHDDYSKGQLFSFYDILTIIQQESKAFGLDDDQIGLSNFSTDKDIL